MGRLVSRGEVWLVDLNPLRGREQAGKRPGLVVSVNSFNQGAANLVVVYRLHLRTKEFLFMWRYNLPKAG